MKECSVDGCGGILYCKGYCTKHYSRLRKTGGITTPRFDHSDVCEVDGCNEPFWCKDLCHEHYDRVRRRKTPGVDRIKKDHKFARRGVDGKRLSVEYDTWQGIKQRCNNPNHKSWKDYGGRGISVCKEWMDDFETFYRDMGPRPSGMSIDRIDVNGNYEAGNCRWATAKEQVANRRCVIEKKEKGQEMTKTKEKNGTLASIDRDIKAEEATIKESTKKLRTLRAARLILAPAKAKKAKKEVKMDRSELATSAVFDG